MVPVELHEYQLYQLVPEELKRLLATPADTSGALRVPVKPANVSEPYQRSQVIFY
jgi:hypothetical protein